MTAAALNNAVPINADIDAVNVPESNVAAAEHATVPVVTSTVAVNVLAAVNVAAATHVVVPAVIAADAV